jgi:mandelate racemase
VRPIEIPLEQPLELAVATLYTTPVVLIDLWTSDGVCGRSYLRTYSTLALRGLARLLEDLAGALIGAPAAPEALERAVPDTLRLLGLRGLVGAALAGLDIALWDCRAQAADRPLHRLLGGAVDRVSAYATVRSRAPETAAAEAQSAAARGFSAIKLKLGGQAGPDDRRLVGAVRAAVGDAIDIMGDFNESLTVAEALARAPELDGLGLAWIEEPTRADDLAGHSAIAAALRTPVQLGENHEGSTDLARSIEARASDLVMLDAMRIGGVSGWMHASGLAARAGLRVSSHSFPEISAHLLAASATAQLLEHLDHLAPIRERGYRVVDGQVELRDEPGLGLRWDEEAVERLLAR